MNSTYRTTFRTYNVKIKTIRKLIRFCTEIRKQPKTRKFFAPTCISFQKFIISKTLRFKNSADQFTNLVFMFLLYTTLFLYYTPEKLSKFSPSPEFSIGCWKLWPNRRYGVIYKWGLETSTITSSDNLAIMTLNWWCILSVK